MQSADEHSNSEALPVWSTAVGGIVVRGPKRRDAFLGHWMQEIELIVNARMSSVYRLTQRV
jgi:hypothetical protein